MKRWEEIMLMLGWLVLLGGVSWLILDKPSINALVPADLTTEIIDQTFTENASLTIDAALIKTLLVWGERTGDGFVTVWLAHDQDRLIAYTNRPKQGLESITGMVVADDRFVDGECMQTCLIPVSAQNGNHHLEIELEPGTTFTLKKISYTT
ncbi:hypothetical protein HY492_02170 [Candidatus Woesearchaeota archaeon]|nr:hypothetical protein [Candidatus Woesearchaeota archaeon]